MKFGIQSAGLLVVACFLAVACSKDNKSQSFAYEWTANGCTTGHHEFANLEAMCTSLQDETFNNTCAVAQRQSYFEKSCSGTFRPAAKSYEFHGAGCTTGRHGFRTTSGMCKALQNEKLNQHCADALREGYFKQQCPGPFHSANVHLNNELVESRLSWNCEGFIVSGDNEILPVGWMAHNARENLLPPGIPEHSSIVLNCLPQ